MSSNAAQRGSRAAVFFAVVAVARSAMLRRSHALVQDDPEAKLDFKMTNMTSIISTPTAKCICDDGFFWHWRLKECIAKGGVGYECGFFPEEHHKFVCQDGLTCKKLDQKRVKYVHPGAVPASCRPCEAEDQCGAGGGNECLKLYTLSGEACAEIEVEKTEHASKKVDKEVTAEATASKTATAEATSSEAGIEVTKSKEATVEATASATAKASAEASAEATGIASGSACVTIEQVKKELGLKIGGKVGAVLAAQVIFKADIMAFDEAYANAVEAAKAKGISLAGDEAGRLAEEKATQEAKMKAQAAAGEEAAKKAEAGAKEAAQDAAEGAADKAAGEAASAKAAADKKAADEKAVADKKSADEKAAADAAAADAAKKDAAAAEKTAAEKAAADEAAKREEAVKAGAKAAQEQNYGPSKAAPPVKVPEEPEKPVMKKVPGDYVDSTLP